MNGAIKNTIIFLAGAVTGGGITAFATRAYFRKKAMEEADSEVEEVRSFYERQVRDLVQLMEEDECDPMVNIGQEIAEGLADGIEAVKESGMSEEKAAEIRQKLTYNHEQKTNYSKMFHESEKSSEDIVDPDNPSMEELGREATEEHKANRHKPPKIISEEAVAELPGYFDNVVLFYYTEDETITNEEDVVIDDPDYLIGDALDKFNFRESDEEIIFVQNFELDTVYEIQKIRQAYNWDDQE